jgi:hypothetical protein
VEFEITPAPSPEEREALLEALAALLTRDPRPAVYRSAWREQGIRESLEDGGEDDYGATGRPRSSPGATRA